MKTDTFNYQDYKLFSENSCKCSTKSNYNYNTYNNNYLKAIREYRDGVF